MELSHAVVVRCQPKLWRASQDEKGRNVYPQLGELIELVWLVIKLLYLLGTDKTFLFGSELKEFLSIPPFLTAINHVAWSIWGFKFSNSGESVPYDFAFNTIFFHSSNNTLEISWLATFYSAIATP